MITVNNLSKFMEIRQEGKSNKKRIVLIFDFHNLIYRNVFIANAQDPTDLEYNYWKYLMMNSIFSNIKRFNPNRVVFAIDDKHSWRKDIFPSYKERRKLLRKESPIDFERFFPIADTFFEGLKTVLSNIFFIKIKGCEGDDIMAVIGKKHKENDVIIISSDNDIKQLIKYKYIKVFDPIKNTWKTSLNIDKELTLKILTGDKGDDIPAVRKKVGIKTAEKLLNEGLDKYLIDKEFKDNYLRNNQLINLDLIPTNIQNNIIETYEKYQIKEIKIQEIWEFLIKNKIRKFIDDLQQYSEYIKILN